jgi:hypothetical protein
LASDFEILSINDFEIKYNFNKLGETTVKHNGHPLQNIVKQPTLTVNTYDPLNSYVFHDFTLIHLANRVFDTMAMLYSKNEHCVTALFASHFYELVGARQEEFMMNGNHILCVPLWLSIIDLAKNWEKRHLGVSLHIGTPLYFLAQAYLLMQNNDKAFAYLIKSIEDDTKLAEPCSMLNYPTNEPAYRTACLIDHQGNYMYEFIVKPLRSEIANSIRNYNGLFGTESHLTSIADLDHKFLQRRNTNKIKVEHIKYLFVLELMKLLQLRTVKIDSEFFPTLLLNRLFGLSLVVDKLLYALYPPKPTAKKGQPQTPSKKKSQKKRGKDPRMWDCIISYGDSLLHKNSQPDIDKLKLYNRSPEKALIMLLQKRTQSKFKVLPREIYPILVSYVIRNTSAHKIQAITLLSSRFDEILQCLMKSVFILAGQMPKQIH